MVSVINENNSKNEEYQMKSYNSLAQFKSHIEKQGKERVTSFDGAKLVTKRGKSTIQYGLYAGQISETVLKKK